MSTISVVTGEMTARRPQRLGTQLHYFGRFTATASYATGGDTLTAKSLGLNKIEGGIVGSAGGYTFELVRQTNMDTAKIKAYDQKDPANAGGADIPGPEVANTTDLSAVVPQFHVWGY